MKRLLVHCLLMTYIAAAPLRAADGVSSRDMHVWRGEFEHALSAEGGELDGAAYLTLAGNIDGALESLAGSADSLRLGILSFKSGRFGEAALLLRSPQANVYLDIYRIFFRASALAEAGRNAEASRELGGLIREDASSILGRRPRELFVETSYRAGADPDSVIALMGGTDRFHGASSLMLADLLLREGRTGESRAAFLRGMEAAPDTISRRLFEGLFEGLSERMEEFDRAELAEVAEACISFGEFSKAERVIDHMESAGPGDHGAMFLRGVLLRAEKKRKKALELFDRIFDSGAPVDLKKSALLESASIEYGLERFERSAGRYRLFGLYYPNDRRSSFALDTAARIYISLEMYDRALDVWEILRERGTCDAISREAALSEAAIRHARGDSKAAYRILKDLPAGVDGSIEPAALYWLHVTAETESEREAWKRRLIAAHPGSFYRMAADGGADIFMLKNDDPHDDAGRLVERLEAREREFVEAVMETLKPAERLYRDEAYEALVYFLERGFVQEARCCVGPLEERFGSDAVSMAALYATVRSSGLVDLGLKLLWAKGLSGPESPVDRTLRYPVAYSSFVAREAERNGLTDELLLAVIREESSFDRFALSRAGALGLMQLMPRTGSWIGGKIRQRRLESEDLLAPEFNISAGAWYLRYLLDRSDDSVVAALASYNGGETRLRRWRESFDPAAQPILAIEMIGPRETRRYVKRVLDSMSNYKRISSNDAGLP